MTLEMFIFYSLFNRAYTQSVSVLWIEDSYIAVEWARKKNVVVRGAAAVFSE